MKSCSHLDQVQVLDLPDPVDGCAECLRSGGEWVHLRMCQTCGVVGCCDSSPNRHANAHAHDAGHPIVRSAQDGEDWSWCYADELMFRLTA